MYLSTLVREIAATLPHFVPKFLINSFFCVGSGNNSRLVNLLDYERKWHSCESERAGDDSCYND